MTLRELYKDPSKLSDIKQLLHRQPHNYTSLPESESDDSERTPIVKPITNISSSKLTLRETARLSLEFCILWFAANYFVAACLEHTTVASSTILTSTSSIWTLLFGSLISVERFTLRKLLGVVASLVGIALISGIDYSGSTGRDENRGSFPHKSPGELALGNGMAVVSAVLYGVYASLIKKRIGDESRVNVALFFGLVGIYNVILLWPGLVVLHFIGVERFQLPPTRRVTAIILVSGDCSGEEGHGLMKRADEFNGEPSIGHLMGPGNAVHVPASRHCRTEPYHPAELDRTDRLVGSIYELDLLGWRIHRALILHLHQSRGGEGGEQF